MGYPHFSGDCIDFHDRVVDWGGTARGDTIVKPRGVITLCGSTRFRADFEAEMRRLTLEGAIVISVGLFGHSEALDLGTDDEPSPVKVMLDNLHFRKIDLADRIHVINPNGYIGTSTRNEIHYAMWRGRRVSALVDIPTAVREEIGEHRFAEDTRRCEWFGCGAMRAPSLK